MNELDKDLLTGEQIVFQTSKHWFSPVRNSVVAVLVIIGSFIARAIAPTGDGIILGPIGNLLVFLANIAVLVGIAWVAYNVFAFLSAHFGVTNLRVLRKEGILRRRSSETLLTALTDVRLLEPALGRMLGYGDVQVYTAAGMASRDSFETVKAAPALRTAIQEPGPTTRRRPAGGPWPRPTGCRARRPSPPVPQPRPLRPRLSPQRPAEASGGRRRRFAGQPDRPARPGSRHHGGVRRQADGDPRPHLGAPSRRERRAKPGARSRLSRAGSTPASPRRSRPLR